MGWQSPAAASREEQMVNQARAAGLAVTDANALTVRDFERLPFVVKVMLRQDFPTRYEQLVQASINASKDSAPFVQVGAALRDAAVEPREGDNIRVNPALGAPTGTFRHAHVGEPLR